ncbi:ABC transporter ATP-binding protein [Streptomyces sp. NBC_00620]|uniref:ABC transporter ATP-binding protein n=1 Tax=unclassified Streptomyces TaxID=2593676 RepID=UPI00224EF8C9|nr:ABC transporter ATP-binding protein [Streptomyces sp. NBC_00620]MCX4978461.1 ABC transporter ATP-binding protein [Streptomyces sp. NBC_00620]WUC15265.1 ABC transporter ATP-binding protein [Streptomyces sp. NBC_00564]WUC48285.1 ABC transporter ATP-binding protein [Streptomyces sp. NBC_00554]
MLTLDGVVAGYGGGDVLHGVFLECAPSTVTCVIGPNGAGKSTVLRVISGLLNPRTGEVRLDGSPLSGLSPRDILRHGVVQVPQSQALFPKMTIAENVLMGGYLIRKDRALLRARLAAVEELVPLVRERAGEPAGNLSGGQRRMVEIGRGLMLEPKVVMLDEPSLGLDPQSLAAVAALIERIHLAGATVLLVEQNVRIGLGLATHGVVMEGGRVRLTGRAAEIAAHPDIGQLYLGAPTTGGAGP